MTTVEMLYKKRIAHIRFSLALLMSALLAAMAGHLTGCTLGVPTRSLTFRVVDANTGQPLKDVNTVRRSRDSTIFTFVLFKGRDGNFQHPNTDGDGVVVAKGLHRSQLHAFSFQKQGYLDGHARTDGTTRNVGLDLPPTDPHHVHRVRRVDARGEIVVPMYPDETPIADYAPVWRRVDEVPPQILSVADKARRRQSNARPDDDHPVKRHALVNQYGDYRVIWLWWNQKLGRYDAELAEVIPPDGIGLYYTGGFPASKGPQTPEEISRRTDR